MSDIEASRRLGSVVVGALQAEGAQPMQAMVALSFALGAMIASGAELGITKPGQSGRLLEHLFRLAETSAEDHLARGRG